MSKKTITNHQIFTFTCTSVLGGSILVITSSITTAAKQDAWISALVTMVCGCFLMWLYAFLGTRYEGLTFIGICQKILGKWIGKIAAAGYVLYLFTTAYSVPWWIGSFGSHVMHETPVPFIIFPYIVALVVAVYYDIEAIVRFSELAFIYIITVLLFSMFLVLPNARIDYILPVFENGIGPILKGAYLLMPFVTFPAIGLLMIYPVNAADIKGGKKALVRGLIGCNLIVFITIFVSILVLGSSIVSKSSFPTLLLAKEINIGTVLTRLEYAISSMWTVSEFMVGVLFFYTCTKALAEFLGLRDHKKIAIPLGLIVFFLSFTVHPSSVDQFNWIIFGFVPNSTLIAVILPVTILIVYLIKQNLPNQSV